MKKNILIICNTFYQLIMVTQLKLTVFEYDNVSVVVTDQSPISVDAIKRLQNKKLFDYVYLTEAKKYGSKKNSLKDKINDVVNIANGRGFKEINTDNIDTLMYYNLDFTALTIFANIYRNNKNVCCARYEEGILSYNNIVDRCSKVIIADLLRKITGNKTLIEQTKLFYCCYPSVYKGNLKTILVPKIDIYGPIGMIMKDVFDIHENQLKYDKKYIYFASIYDFEGSQSIGEIDFVREIRNHVGNENLLVKVHPRDTRTVYNDEGFNIDRNSNIPWEAIQLNLKCEEMVFITANSGSVLSVNMMLSPMPRTIFGYKCCKITGNQLAEVTINNIESLLHDESLQEYLENVQIISSISEI